ncbi:OmpP1/FadL family transporter [Fusobacterium ulcerans]|uniref:OmpP1/FadL family transporter n=1 Tax=Fusobacterium ulcerans TaxID=861 RepID=UPI001D0B5C5F|nr:porin family protein [Fusobacterium ulcerans]MCB8566076.1 porin family protein [Fusobacterium ulcerans]MCB8650772.1 porin family protein [Fusobacterium ulcerans]
MKNIRNTVFLCGFLLGETIYAIGGVELLTNTTVGSIANPAMQTSISNESVFYNPAAISFLNDGRYIYLGGYAAKINYKMEVNNMYIKTTTPQVIPSFSYLQKNGKYSYYLGFGMSGQGGKLKIDTTIPLLNNMEANIIHGGVSFGVSYLINNNLSFSFGGKGNYSKIELKGKLENQNIKNNKNSESFTFETGVYYKLSKKINLSGKYLHKTKQDYGGDLAGLLSLGISYKLTEKERINMGYNIILEENNYNNSYEYAISLQKEINSKFNLSLGYSYSDRGNNNDEVYTFTELSSHQIGIGGEYLIQENIVIGLVVGLIDYENKSSKSTKPNIESSRIEKIAGLSIKIKY